MLPANGVAGYFAGFSSNVINGQSGYRRRNRSDSTYKMGPREKRLAFSDV
jgi:hypothetical protein